MSGMGRVFRKCEKASMKGGSDGENVNIVIHFICDRLKFL